MKDVVARIRAAKTPEERTSIAFDFAKRNPEEAQKLGWENPMLSWQLYQEAQDLGLPLGEIGLEGGHNPTSAKQSINDAKQSTNDDWLAKAEAASSTGRSTQYRDPEQVHQMKMDAKDRNYESSPEAEHERRTGEWKSPVTGEWYKKNEKTGKYVSIGGSPDTPSPDMAESAPFSKVAEAVDGVSGGLQDTDKREISGMGWDQPVLDVSKWKAQDPHGYEKARREAFSEGREGPRMSDIPDGVWDWGDDNLPKGGIEFDPKKQGREAYSHESAASKTREATPIDSGDTQKLRHTAMPTQPESDRGIVNDLGAFIFGDSTLGQENILSKILTGLFG